MPTTVLLTRGSPLALKQAELSAETLRRGGNHGEVVIKVITTTGDRQQAWNLEKAGGAGLFTGELENALLNGEGDIAVHSAKDLPSSTASGLALAGCLPRANPADVLIRRVAPDGGGLAPALIATGSPRRRAQALVQFPHARFTQLRGNVDTRLQKIASGEADATFLAAAGLERLGIRQWPGLVFEPQGLEKMVPAAGQGAIAWETRAGDAPRFAPLCDPTTTAAVTIERIFLSRLGAGCHSAFACHWRDAHLYLFHEATGWHAVPFPLAATDAPPANIPPADAAADSAPLLAARVETILQTLGIPH